MTYRLSLIFTFMVGMLWASSVSAVNITPTKQSLTLDPGTTKTVHVTVTNDSAQTVTLTPSVDAFTVDGETGAAIFGQTDSARQWIRISPTQETLPAGEQRDIGFSITIPNNAAPGAHYLGLFVQTKSDGDTVRADTRIGSLLFLYVSGTVQESMMRKEFSPDKKIIVTSRPSFFLNIINDGNIHVIPKGDAVATDVFGRVVSAVRLNEEQIKILPNESFARPIIFGALPQTVVGPVDVSVRVTYGLTEQTFFTHARIWAIPPLFIGALIVVVLAIGCAWIVYKRRHV